MRHQHRTGRGRTYLLVYGTKMTSLRGQRLITEPYAPRPVPLSLFWRRIIVLSAFVGIGTCAALGFVYVHFFVVHFGTMAVLERPATERDVVGVNRMKDGEARLESARFLAAYESTDYYAAKGSSDEDFCLVGKALSTGDYWEVCRKMSDGRDAVAYVMGPDGRHVALVPDQLDHAALEADGWVTIHDNLMIQPLPPCGAPRIC